MKNIVISIICVSMLLISSATFAKKGANKINLISKVRTLTAAKTESVLTGKKFISKIKTGYHVGSDIRYQPSSKDSSYTRLDGGKDKFGKYINKKKY